MKMLVLAHPQKHALVMPALIIGGDHEQNTGLRNLLGRHAHVDEVMETILYINVMER